jgi:hypothetical protein
MATPGSSRVPLVLDLATADATDVLFVIDFQLSNNVCLVGCISFVLCCESVSSISLVVVFVCVQPGGHMGVAAGIKCPQAEGVGVISCPWPARAHGLFGRSGHMKAVSAGMTPIAIFTYAKRGVASWAH